MNALISAPSSVSSHLFILDGSDNFILHSFLANSNISNHDMSAPKRRVVYHCMKLKDNFAAVFITQSFSATVNLFAVLDRVEEFVKNESYLS